METEPGTQARLLAVVSLIGSVLARPRTARLTLHPYRRLRRDLGHKPHGALLEYYGRSSRLWRPAGS